MFTVHQLAKSFALNSLFSEVTFSVNGDDRVGLVGVNGCGKSTLLRIIAGEETADSGHVDADPGLRIGYLPQGFDLHPGASLAEVVGRAAGDVAVLETELLALAQPWVNGRPTRACRVNTMLSWNVSVGPIAAGRPLFWPVWAWTSYRRTCPWKD